jgi:hypothetical protein
MITTIQSTILRLLSQPNVDKRLGTRRHYFTEAVTKEYTEESSSSSHETLTPRSSGWRKNSYFGVRSSVKLRMSSNKSPTPTAKDTIRSSPCSVLMKLTLCIGQSFLSSASGFDKAAHQDYIGRFLPVKPNNLVYAGYTIVSNVQSVQLRTRVSDKKHLHARFESRNAAYCVMKLSNVL